MELFKDVYLWAILGFMAAGMITCFMWGYVLGMAQVEIEEENHKGEHIDPLDRCNWS